MRPLIIIAMVCVVAGSLSVAQPQELTAQELREATLAVTGMT